MRRAARFTYDGYELDRAARRLLCRYSVGAHRFTEEIRFGEGGAVGEGGDVGEGGEGSEGGAVGEGGEGGEDAGHGGAWTSGAVEAAARIVYLLAGVSYYKTTAPPVVDLGDMATTEAERSFVRTFYVEGLAEFAMRNELDLSGLEVVGPALGQRDRVRAGSGGAPLVPFGGGIDSIVTAEHVRRLHPGASLFVVSRSGDRFDAIERAAGVSGLPVARAERTIDPAVSGLARPGARGAAPTPAFMNGHVPVTGIVSAIAVMAAVLSGAGAVVMSNERSASVPTRWRDGRGVNHQWSKGLDFERGFRELLTATFEDAPDYFSFLRARTELWVAREFAALERYHGVFRSCNRAFALDPSRRLDAWCGECDKCAFIDLVLAPYLSAEELAAVFGGAEPLCAPTAVPQLRALVGTGDEPRPFECVGDEDECRVAALLAAARPDRSGCAPLQQVAAEVRASSPELAEDDGGVAASSLLEESEAHFVPAAFVAGEGGAEHRPLRGAQRPAGRSPARVSR